MSDGLYLLSAQQGRVAGIPAIANLNSIIKIILYQYKINHIR